MGLSSKMSLIQGGNPVTISHTCEVWYHVGKGILSYRSVAIQNHTTTLFCQVVVCSIELALCIHMRHAIIHNNKYTQLVSTGCLCIPADFGLNWWLHCNREQR